MFAWFAHTQTPSLDTNPINTDTPNPKLSSVTAVAIFATHLLHSLHSLATINFHPTSAFARKLQLVRQPQAVHPNRIPALLWVLEALSNNL